MTETDQEAFKSSENLKLQSKSNSTCISTTYGEELTQSLEDESVIDPLDFLSSKEELEYPNSMFTTLYCDFNIDTSIFLQSFEQPSNNYFSLNKGFSMARPLQNASQNSQATQ